MKVNLTVIQYKNLFNINKNLKTISTDISTSKRYCFGSLCSQRSRKFYYRYKSNINRGTNVNLFRIPESSIKFSTHAAIYYSFTRWHVKVYHSVNTRGPSSFRQILIICFQQHAEQYPLCHSQESRLHSIPPKILHSIIWKNIHVYLLARIIIKFILVIIP